jgi:hypothetical protein
MTTTTTTKIISQGEMLSLLSSFTDAETRDRLLRGEITLKSFRGEFKCAPTPRGAAEASPTPGHTPATGDLGDQIVAFMERERGNRSLAPAFQTNLVDPSGDLGDQVVALLEKERAGRAEVRR